MNIISPVIKEIPKENFILLRISYLREYYGRKLLKASEEYNDFVTFSSKYFYRYLFYPYFLYKQHFLDERTKLLLQVCKDLEQLYQEEHTIRHGF